MKRVWLLLIFTLSQLSAEMKILTESLPPYQYQKGMVKGVSVEVVRAILERVGQRDTIEITSWNRAYSTVQNQEGVAVFPASRTPQREMLFQWVGPIFKASNRFLYAEGEQYDISSLEDAKKLESIGVVSNSSRHLMLKEEGFSNLTTHYDNDANYRALLNGRVQMIIANPLIAEFQLKALGAADHSVVDSGFELYHSDVYIIFNKNADSKTIHHWQVALDSLKKDGSYQEIYEEAYKAAQEDFDIR